MPINLKADATEASHNAYSPYSRLKVGAALCSANGKVYKGCNVENASFTVGACAERAAITAAVFAEGKSFELRAIAVVAFTENGEALPITPCGACRQALVEFGEQAEVGFLNADGEWMTVPAKELLPYRFEFPSIGPDHVEV